MEHRLTLEHVERFQRHLRELERGTSTIAKYRRDIMEFLAWSSPEGRVEKETVVRWKEWLSQRYCVNTVNGKLAALNGLFVLLGWHECRVRPLKRQREVFRPRERELTKGEYLRLLSAAKGGGNERLYLLMEALCSTGMRVSELCFVTVEALEQGFAVVNCKGKRRTVLLTKRLRRALICYCRKRDIVSGPVFTTRRGKPLDRSNIWREMKALCQQAGVDARKVFPHNLRHLFAVAFYRLEKDIAKLADLLGHASIETTRIYIMESSVEHIRRIEQLGLVL